MFDKFKNAANAVTDRIHNVSDGAGGMVEGMIMQLMEGLPAMQDAGYLLNELEVEMGIPPKLIPHFEKTKDVGYEDIRAIIDAQRDKKIVVAVLEALVEANKLQRSLSFGKMRFTELEVELTIPPAIKLKYLPQ